MPVERVLSSERERMGDGGAREVTRALGDDRTTRLNGHGKTE